MFYRRIFIKFLFVQGIYSSIFLKRELPQREERSTNIADPDTAIVSNLGHAEVVQMPRVAKNISLCGNLDSLVNISPEIEWFTGQLRFYKIYFSMDSYDKEIILVTRNPFL